jgi:hypothetical protein
LHPIPRLSRASSEQKANKMDWPDGSKAAGIAACSLRERIGSGRHVVLAHARNFSGEKTGGKLRKNPAKRLVRLSDLRPLVGRCSGRVSQVRADVTGDRMASQSRRMAMSFQSVSDADLRRQVERVRQLVDWLGDRHERRAATATLLADMEAELGRRTLGASVSRRRHARGRARRSSRAPGT